MGKEIDPVTNSNPEGIPDPVDSSPASYKDEPYTPELTLDGDEPESSYTPELSLEGDKADPEFSPELTLDSDDPEPLSSPDLTLESDDPEPLSSPDLTLESGDPEPLSSPDLTLESDDPEPEVESESSSDLFPDENEEELQFSESEQTSEPVPEPEVEMQEHEPESVPEPEVDAVASSQSSAPSGSADESTSPKKRHRFIIPLVILLLVGVIAGGFFLYTRELNNPQEIVKRYVTAASNLDFDKLESMTQSQDMSVLEGADVQSPLFRDFFLDCNKKLSCEIAGANMNVNQGTAQITAHLRFVDNTNIYRAALSELLLQTVENSTPQGSEAKEQAEPEDALAGDAVIESPDTASDESEVSETAVEELPEKVSEKADGDSKEAADAAEEAADAAEKAANAAEEADNDAEILSDSAEAGNETDTADAAESEDETASATASESVAPFTIDEEMQQRILDLILEKQLDLEPEYVETDIVYNLIKVNRDWKLVALDRETVRAISANCVSIQAEIDRLRENPDTFIDNRHLAEENVFSLDTDQYSIQYVGHHVEEDYAGHPCLFLYYDYTNKGDHPAGALMDVNLSVLQHGKKCVTGIPERNRTDTASYLKEVKPGETAKICQVFALMDLSDVTVQAYEGSRLSERELHSVVIRLE